MKKIRCKIRRIAEKNETLMLDVISQDVTWNIAFCDFQDLKMNDVVEGVIECETGVLYLKNVKKIGA